MCACTCVCACMGVHMHVCVHVSVRVFVGSGSPARLRSAQLPGENQGDVPSRKLPLSQCMLLFAVCFVCMFCTMLLKFRPVIGIAQCFYDLCLSEKFCAQGLGDHCRETATGPSNYNALPATLLHQF